MSGYTAEQWTAAGFNAAYYKASNSLRWLTDIYGTTDAAILAHYVLHGNSRRTSHLVLTMKAWLRC